MILFPRLPPVSAPFCARPVPLNASIPSSPPQHQDYGYWYSNYLRPDLASCFIAVDRCTQANGALTVLRGSHKIGRIDHTDVRGQPGGEPERVAQLEAEFDTVVAEMDSGDIRAHIVATFLSPEQRHSRQRFTTNPAPLCCTARRVSRWALGRALCFDKLCAPRSLACVCSQCSSTATPSTGATRT
eukprot:SAG22_NODE_250_length_13779_cov_6.413450_3_plen_186_part_00